MPCSRCSRHIVCSVAVSSSDLSPVWATSRRPGKCALWSPLNLVCGSRTDYISAASFTQGQLWARQEACPAQPSPLLSLHPCPDLAGCPLSESSGSRMRKAALWVILKALLKRAAPPQTKAESSEESQLGHSKCPCSLAWAWVLPGVGHHPPRATLPFSHVRGRDSRSMSTTVLFLGKHQLYFSNKLMTMITKQGVCSRR